MFIDDRQNMGRGEAKKWSGLFLLLITSSGDLLKVDVQSGCEEEGLNIGHFGSVVQVLSPRISHHLLNIFGL